MKESRKTSPKRNMELEQECKKDEAKEIKLKLELMQKRHEEALRNITKKRAEEIMSSHDFQSYSNTMNKKCEKFNKDLKTELDLARKEIQSLKARNKHLEEQCERNKSAQFDKMIRNTLDMRSNSSKTYNQLPPPPPVDVPYDLLNCTPDDYSSNNSVHSSIPPPPPIDVDSLVSMCLQDLDDGSGQKP